MTKLIGGFLKKLDIFGFPLGTRRLIMECVRSTLPCQSCGTGRNWIALRQQEKLDGFLITEWRVISWRRLLTVVWGLVSGILIVLRLTVSVGLPILALLLLGRITTNGLVICYVPGRMSCHLGGTHHPGYGGGVCSQQLVLKELVEPAVTRPTARIPMITVVNPCRRDPTLASRGIRIAVTDLTPFLRIQSYGGLVAKALCCASVKELQALANLQHTLLPSSIVIYWIPPSSNRVQINCDASVKDNFQRAGFSCVIRNNLGNWIKGCNGTIMMSTVLRVELFAIWKGLLLAWECAFKDVICKSDCLDAFLASRKLDHMSNVANKDLLIKIFDVIHWVEKSMRKAKKNIGSKNDLEKACKSGDFTKKEEYEAEKRSYSHRIGANLDFLEI
ncbi:hypothetical protein PIB30_016552 [Stylosanthes scabra]|uniref:RNase H type-1 domain-containing protein n=1 Tax=Stylosanthes scabra TaxID=79078 RepID=A0ABU6R7M5_9FABA|nr:hypothetical protein [Stylosanthes scabra]